MKYQEQEALRHLIENKSRKELEEYSLYLVREQSSYSKHAILILSGLFIVIILAMITLSSLEIEIKELSIQVCDLIGQPYSYLREEGFFNKELTIGCGNVTISSAK